MPSLTLTAIVMMQFENSLSLESGEKSAIHWFRNYLVIVTQDAASGRSTGRPGEVDDKVKSILTIFDLQNKFIAYTAPVRAVVALVRLVLLVALNEVVQL